MDAIRYFTYYIIIIYYYVLLLCTVYKLCLQSYTLDSYMCTLYVYAVLLYIRQAVRIHCCLACYYCYILLFSYIIIIIIYYILLHITLLGAMCDDPKYADLINKNLPWLVYIIVLYIYVYMYMCLCIYVCVCVCLYMCVCMCVCMYV